MTSCLEVPVSFPLGYLTKSLSVKKFRDYRDLLFEIPNVKFIYNHWKSDCNVDSLLIITQKLLNRNELIFWIWIFKVSRYRFQQPKIMSHNL